jgi:hypothetical protein
MIEDTSRAQFGGLKIVNQKVEIFPIRFMELRPTLLRNQLLQSLQPCILPWLARLRCPSLGRTVVHNSGYLAVVSEADSLAYPARTTRFPLHAIPLSRLQGHFGAIFALQTSIKSL